MKKTLLTITLLTLISTTNAQESSRTTGSKVQVMEVANLEDQHDKTSNYWTEKIVSMLSKADIQPAPSQVKDYFFK